MNPIRPCPRCGKDWDFHEDELEEVKEGMTFCLSCGLALEEASFMNDVVAGKHPEFVSLMLDGEEDDDGEDAVDE